MAIHDLKPDAEPIADQLELIEKLTDSQLYEIDRAILSNCGYKWKKVARVVATTIEELPNRIEGIPDRFYSERIHSLVVRGVLEVHGDLSYMRYSEVRKSSGYET